jgi:hypothetical protein
MPLRYAFDAAMKDKDLLAEAEKQGLEINPVPGEEMQKILTRVYDTRKALIDRLAEASKEPTGLKQLPRRKRNKATAPALLPKKPVTRWRGAAGKLASSVFVARRHAPAPAPPAHSHSCHDVRR